MVDYLEEISNVQTKLLTYQLGPAIEALSSRFCKAIKNGNKYGEKLFFTLLQQLHNFISQMPVLGYNCSKFDNRVLRRHLLPSLFKRYGRQVKTQMKGGSYTRIVCPSMMFLDQLNYLSAKTSYDQFIYNSLGKKLKSKLPYSWITNLDCLKYPGLPDLEYWYSDLKKCNVLSIDYESYMKYLENGLTSDQALSNLCLNEIPKPGEEVLSDCRAFFKLNNFQTFKDYVAFYLDKDCSPFVAAAEKQNKIFFEEYSVQLYRSNCSIPSVAVKIGMQYMNENEIFIPCESSYKLFRQTPGGQSLIITMEALAGITKIREYEFAEEALTCQSIFSLDANLLYGHCMSQLPVGHEILRLADQNFIPEYASKRYTHYKNAERIISFVIWDMRLRNAVTFLRGGEWKCSSTSQKFQPDCIVEQWNGDKFVKQVVIECFGDAGHTCPIHNVCLENFHPIRKHKDGTSMTFREVENSDKQRLQLLQYEFDLNEIKVVYMCQFKVEYESETGEHHHRYLEFLDTHPQYKVDKKPLTEQQLLKKIFDGQLHGFLLADFEADNELKAKTELFPLFFHKAEVSREDVGSIMHEYLTRKKLLRKPRMELISSHRGKRLLIATNLVQFYMEMGVKITNIDRLIQYELSGSMNPMVQKAVNLRFKASNDEQKVLGENIFNSHKNLIFFNVLKGNLMKSLVVSCFGRFLLNPKNFTRTKYVTGTQLLKELYAGSFISVDVVAGLPDICDHLYEIKSRPKVLHHNSPVQLGSWILNSAKLQILSLIYKVIQPCMDPRSYTIFCSQTDSVSIVSSEKDFRTWLKKCVLKGQERKLAELSKKYFTLTGNDEASKKSFFEAGRFKEEWHGTACFGLSSKVYCVFNDQKTIVKLSARSVPHAQAKSLGFFQFSDVLHKHKTITIEFESFNYVSGEMLSEKMRKNVITPMYIKREIMPDLSTKTLDL
ncbi:MAG: hypothetical protein GY804_04345 [Alphaproteobacteria bacterium]|nr:hypothetical protein [Alphaproteobacteria bacterium]